MMADLDTDLWVQENVIRDYFFNVPLVEQKILLPSPIAYLASGSLLSKQCEL